MMGNTSTGKNLEIDEVEESDLLVGQLTRRFPVGINEHNFSIMLKGN